MKHKKTVLGLIAAVVIAVVIFGFFKSDTSSKVSVSTVKVTKNDIAKLVTATGTVEPINQVHCIRDKKNPQEGERPTQPDRNRERCLTDRIRNEIDGEAG